MPADRKRVPKKKALLQRPPYDPEQRVVAVTGAYSFVGAELIKRLERDRRYYKVLAIDIRKPTFAMSKTQFHKIDLTMPTADADLAAVWKREGVDTVVHAAFLSTPTHANAWAHTVVYGAHPLNPNFLVEEHELRGGASRSRFVRDKVEVERQVRRFAHEHADTIVTTLRTAAALGPRIHNFATRFFTRPVAPTLMGYDPLMQLVHERDVIDAFNLAVDNDFAGEFNIVGDGVLPYSTILAMMGKVPLPLPHFLARPLSRALWATQVFDSPPNFLDFLRFLCVADGGKARKVMGFAPVYDIKATIHDFLGVATPETAENGGRLQHAAGGV